MTAVQWLLQELEKVNYHPTEAMIMYAKKLERDLIIKTAMDHMDYEEVEMEEERKKRAEKYYETRYKSAD